MKKLISDDISRSALHAFRNYIITTVNISFDNFQIHFRKLSLSLAAGRSTVFRNSFLKRGAPVARFKTLVELPACTSCPTSCCHPKIIFSDDLILSRQPVSRLFLKCVVTVWDGSGDYAESVLLLRFKILVPAVFVISARRRLQSRKKNLNGVLSVIFTNRAIKCGFVSSKKNESELVSGVVRAWFCIQTSTCSSGGETPI